MNRAVLRLGLLPALALPGCGGSHPQPAAKPPVVSVAVSRQQPISEIVTGEAELFPYQEAELAPKISSPISRYYVQLGDHVHKGQLLVTLENRDLAASVAAANGALQQAEAKYATTTAASVPQEIQKAEADEAKAKANLEAQQRLFDSRTWLYRQGAIARKQVDQAEVALVSAKAAFANAQRQLAGLKATVAKATEQSATGQLNSARANERAAQVQLQYSELRSPINGVVTERNLYPGDIAPSGTPLVTVMNVSRIIAKLHLPQEEAALLKLGDAATVQENGAGVPGNVTVINPALDPNSTTREVWVEVPNSQSKLPPGGSAPVQIVAKTVPNAVVVPASAVITESSGATRIAALRPGDIVAIRPVQTGIQQGGEIQIVSGLSPGQKVVSSGGYGLPDGTKVRLAKS